MSYGHATMMFLDPVEAQAYLDACERDKNRTAENYQDRVAAQRCVMNAEGWTPVPLPPIDSSKTRASARPTRRAKSPK